jgi:cytoskeletal protein RodZ
VENPDTMNELGQMLREAREGQGISLAEAEAQTRIRQKFLAAMEAEEWSLLPNEVTTRGFLRKYANYLALDEEAVLRAFQNRANVAAPQPIVAAPLEREADYRPIEMDLSSPPRRTMPWGWIGAAIVLLALAGVAIYIALYQPGFIDNLRALPRALPNPADVIALEPTATPTATVEVNRITATPTPTVETTPTPTSTPTPVQAEEAIPTTTLTAEATPTVPTPAVQPAELIGLDLAILARSWVRVVVDNSLALEAVLEPGELRSWQASDSIVLRTGNAAGVQATVNNQTLPPLGGTGEVIEIEWRLVDGQVVQSTATPLPSPPPETPAPEDTPTPEPSSGG